jgi:hypothetical protein
VSTQILLDVNNAYARGSDIKIVFDPSRLELVKVRPLAQEQTALKTFLPIYESRKFAEALVIRRANSEGILEFSAITADTNTGKLTQTVTGKIALAELTFVIKKEGNATVAFLTNHPTLDSTVVEEGNPPLNILTKTNILMITMDSPTPTLTIKKTK